MTEKYKIYISEDTKTRLINDAELFEFTRPDGTVNLNGFLKELIVNYFEQYRKDNDELLENMLSDLTSVKSLKSKDASLLADRIIRTYINNKETGSGKSAVITLTVSGESYKIFQIFFIFLENHRRNIWYCTTHCHYFFNFLSPIFYITLFIMSSSFFIP